MPSILRNAYLAASPEPNLERLVDKTKTMLLAFEDVSDEQLRAIRAPTLVMMGDSDVVRTDHALEMFRKIPRAQLAVFPGAPHGAYIGAAEYANSATRQPEWAAGMIEEFLHAP